MAIINQYKAIYPITNSKFENEDVYINATSMEKAVNMITTEKGSEPKIISLTNENILTEVTEETTVDFTITSYYLDDDENEVEVSDCIAYPTSLNDVTRGSTIYMQTPSYTLTEDDTEVTYTFSKWVYDETEYTSNPQVITIPLDESVTTMAVKCIYTRTES